MTNSILTTDTSSHTVTLAQTAPDGRSTGFLRISPAMAEGFLKKNLKNRTLRAARVAIYVDEMTRGEWLDTHQGIAFDTSGNLVDGQHRLAAMVESGKTYTLPVTFNVSERAVAAMDTVSPRTAADILTMEGHPYGNRLAALCGFLKEYDKMMSAPNPGQGGTPWHGRLKTTEAQEFITTHPKVLSVISEVSKTMKGVPTNVRFIDGCYYLFREIDPSSARIFVEQFVYGLNLTPNSPWRVLRERLLQNKLTQNKNRKLNGKTILAYMFKAWNAWRAGAEVKTFHFKANEKFPTLI